MSPRGDETLSLKSEYYSKEVRYAACRRPILEAKGTKVVIATTDRLR